MTISIAQQNASIAKATRRDSNSMSVIATLTMIYLPSTLVCGLFWTNFFELNTDQEQPVFMVSRLWWIFPLCSLFLTAFTISIWLCWKRYRVQPAEECDV
jgi:Mg2+ and Co2+ transporter CorA